MSAADYWARAAEQLISWAREHRPTEVVPTGDLTDPNLILIAEQDTALLQAQLEQTALPSETLEMLVPTPRGFERIPTKAAAAPPFDPASCMPDAVAMGLAWRIGYFRDAAARKAAA